MPSPFSIFGIYGYLFRDSHAPALDPETASGSNTPWCKESDEVPLEEQDLPDPFSKGPLKVPTTSTTTAKKEGALTDKWSGRMSPSLRDPEGSTLTVVLIWISFVRLCAFFQGHSQYVLKQDSMPNVSENDHL